MPSTTTSIPLLDIWQAIGTDENFKSEGVFQVTEVIQPAWPA
jgi:hypothetical protein